MKVLFFDVELAPNLATVWGIWNQNIGINQLLDTSRLMCYAAKWKNSKEMLFNSEHKVDHEVMVKELHELLSEADVVVHYNGDSFDIPVLNREFLLYGMPPPEPFRSVDLLRTIRKRFRFVSNKLDHVVQELNLGKKEKYEGHELWLKCMNHDEKSWKTMEKYNKQDVTLLEKLYDRILPWIDTHPNHNLYIPPGSDAVCPTCGGTHVIRKGIQHLKNRSYQRYRCQDCGTPIRSVRSIVDTSVTVTQVGA